MNKQFIFFVTTNYTFIILLNLLVLNRRHLTILINMKKKIKIILNVQSCYTLKNRKKNRFQRQCIIFPK